MCGIVGGFALRGEATTRPEWSRLGELIAHRGPDGAGCWTDGPFSLSHRRLSIIGLETGAQPMRTADGSLVVTFNGEIYNDRELRSELIARGHVFRTDSDTEVLLHGYREWGERLPEKLVGMFAFAIADVTRKELFLARDRFGEKPLFYRRTDDAFVFASELAPIAAIMEERRVNQTALGSYLLLNYVPGTETMLAGVKRLPPGSWMRLSSARTEWCRYWEFPSADGGLEHLSHEEVCEGFRARFDTAVRHTLRADVPVGVFLSGGIDSSLVAESAMRQGGLNRAFVLDIGAGAERETTYNERSHAERVAQKLGLEIESIPFDAGSVADFDSLVEHADDPLADSSALAVWCLSRQTARTNKVVLAGDGGDELLGGYLTYKATAMHRRYFRRVPKSIKRSIGWLAERMPTGEGKGSFSYKLPRFLRAMPLKSSQAHFTWNGTWLPSRAASFLRSEVARRSARDTLLGLTRGYGIGSSPDLLALQRADVNEYLPNDILAKGDRMTMAHGLESRSPFLNHDLAAWCLSLPDQHKIGPGGELKRVLRTVARETFGPEIADRPKEGFSIPVHGWIRGPLRETAEDLLSVESLERTGLFDVPQVRGVVADHLSGRRSFGFELWGLMVLMRWHRTRIESRPSIGAVTPDMRAA